MLSIEHWLVVLLVVVLVFGTKKIGNIGHDLGRAIRGFKEGMKESEEKPTSPAQSQAIQHEVIDHESTKTESSHTTNKH